MQSSTRDGLARARLRRLRYVNRVTSGVISRPRWPRVITIILHPLTLSAAAFLSLCRSRCSCEGGGRWPAVPRSRRRRMTRTRRSARSMRATSLCSNPMCAHHAPVPSRRLYPQHIRDACHRVKARTTRRFWRLRRISRASTARSMTLWASRSRTPVSHRPHSGTSCPTSR